MDEPPAYPLCGPRSLWWQFGDSDVATVFMSTYASSRALGNQCKAALPTEASSRVWDEPLEVGAHLPYRQFSCGITVEESYDDVLLGEDFVVIIRRSVSGPYPSYR